MEYIVQRVRGEDYVRETRIPGFARIAQSLGTFLATLDGTHLTVPEVMLIPASQVAAMRGIGRSMWGTYGLGAREPGAEGWGYDPMGGAAVGDDSWQF